MDQKSFILKWEYAGTLFNPISDDRLLNSKGVYIWVYNSEPKRILYVGACPNISFRQTVFTDDTARIKNGKTYMFKMIKDFDPYKEFLTAPMESYPSLVQSDMFWMPDPPKDILPQWKNKTPYWVLDQSKDYMRNISVYVCPMELKDSREYSVFLQSQIQFLLKEHFNLTYFISEEFETWLGHLEVLSNPQMKLHFLDYKFQFFKLPTVDSETTILLDNLLAEVKKHYKEELD